jgi:hypothetical protein
MLMSSGAENSRKKSVNLQIAGVRRLHSAFAIACTKFISLLAAGTLCNRRGRLARRIAYVLSEALRAGAILVNVKILSHLFLVCFFLGILRLPASIFSSDCDRHSINQIIIQLAHEKCSNVLDMKKHGLIFEPI